MPTSVSSRSVNPAECDGVSPVSRSNKLFQIGTGNVSVAAEVAEVQKLLRASGLSYTMHASGTTVDIDGADYVR